MMMIATVVVTYNRLNLLKECITALRNQTKKIDEIVVINNSSTDGTEEWLKRQTDITTITQQNLGGAGGFYTGTKYAFEKGFDWIWLMDDDGVPDNYALDELTKNIDEDLEVLNSLVIKKNNSSQLVFGLENPKTKEIFFDKKKCDKKQFISGANFFNGTFINKKVIDKVGMPNPHFYIYGDEVEYLFRLISFNIVIKTICSSIIKHPKRKLKIIGKGKFKHKFYYSNKIRATYFPRNLFIIFSMYNNFPVKRLIKIYLMDIYGILIQQKNVKILLIYLSSIFSGIFNVYVLDRKT